MEIIPFILAVIGIILAYAFVADKFDALREKYLTSSPSPSPPASQMTMESETTSTEVPRDRVSWRMPDGSNVNTREPWIVTRTAPPEGWTPPAGWIPPHADWPYCKCDICEWQLLPKLLRSHGYKSPFNQDTTTAPTPPSRPFVVPTRPVTPDSNLTDVQKLEKIRDSCLALFEKKPLKKIPAIAIHPQEHFKGETILAHWENRNTTICFSRQYLDRPPDPSDLVDTMKHELLHAWIHQHDFAGDRHHDDVFKAAAEILGIKWWEGFRNT